MKYTWFQTLDHVYCIKHVKLYTACINYMHACCINYSYPIHMNM